MKIARVFAAALLAMATLLSLAPAARAQAELTLKEAENFKLPNQMEYGKPYVLKLGYLDPDGDKIKSAQFIEEKPTQITHDYKRVEGDVAKGATLVWEINGFEKGAHSGHFIVKSSTGKEVRYPPADKGEYNFAVTSITDLWIKTLIGMFACLMAIPFLFYLSARALNRQGNPSSAARAGLMLGIIGAAAVFIIVFFGTYDWMTLGLAGVAALALLIIVLTRR